MHNFFNSKKTEVQRIIKNGAKITKTISYRLQCIDSLRFMASSLPNLKEFIKLNVNMDMTINNVKTVKLNTKIVIAVWWPIVANFNLSQSLHFKLISETKWIYTFTYILFSICCPS